MKHKKVLITGGSRGIGKAVVDYLDMKKYLVVSPTRDILDLSDDRSIEEFIKKYKKNGFDIIINNAGINYPQWIEDVTDENIAQTIQVNLIAPIKLIRGFVPHMKKNMWGRIVNISSVFGVIARGKQIIYTATKHGINGATKSLALELASYNVLVNSVCPGFCATDMVLRNSKEKIRSIEKDIPLRRIANPKEIAPLVEFLISDLNTYITGETIVIDGGFTIK